MWLSRRLLNAQRSTEDHVHSSCDGNGARKIGCLLLRFLHGTFLMQPQFQCYSYTPSEPHRYLRDAEWSSYIS